MPWNRVPAAVAIGLLASAAAAHGQTLRYSADGEARYQRTQSDVVEQTVNGSRQRSEIESFWRFTVAPEADTDEGLTVRIVHDSLAVTVAGGGPASPDLGEVTGVPFVVHMDERGRVREVVLPGVLPEAARRLDLRTTYGTFFPVLPAGEVAPGDAWTDTTRVRQEQNGIDLSITRVTHYVAEGPDAARGPGAVRVSYQAELTLEGNGVQQSADVALSGTGRAAGEFWFRPDPGVYLGGREESERRMVGLVHVAGQSALVPIVHARSETVEKLD